MKNVLILIFILSQINIFADGKVVRRQLEKYEGSLEESAQEAIIIYKTVGGKGIENLILKIKVEGNDDEFAWVVPFPQPPKIYEEKAVIFDELFNYVEFMKAPVYSSKKSSDSKSAADSPEEMKNAVKVISRKTVGSFEAAVVTTEKPEALNEWLKSEGYQDLIDQDDVIKSYIDKKYCFACIKVKRDSDIGELHPLRFEFETGGSDGIYFPMKMTGLQTAPFNINLYVFYGAWLNDNINKFGYKHHGFNLKYRDRDTKNCKPNAGKSWSAPDSDPLLNTAAHKIPNVQKLFSKLYPGERFYLTNITSRNVEPKDMRQWKDDLWLFPYYTKKSRVPTDVANNLAAGFWPDDVGKKPISEDNSSVAPVSAMAVTVGAVVLLVGVSLVIWLIAKPK